MHRRQHEHAQRQHIIYSVSLSIYHQAGLLNKGFQLDSLLLQLHSLSCFLSPSLLILIIRLVSQFICSKPRDIDHSRSLLFWYGAVVFLSFAPFWTHVTDGAADGRSILLDFVGQGVQLIALASRCTESFMPANIPSRLHIVLLDTCILFLQLVHITIAYENSLIPKTSTDVDMEPHPPTDTRLPTPLPSPFPESFSTPPTPPLHSSTSPTKTTFLHESPYIIDLRLSHIIERLRKPAPDAALEDDGESLPFPNTTSSWPVPNGIRVLMRARAEVRRRQAQQSQQRLAQSAGDMQQRVPGGMDAEST